MIVANSLITAEELLLMPTDDFNYELIEGELNKLAPAGYRHGRIAINLTGSLYRYVQTHNLGVVCAAETGFKIKSNPDTVRAPDVAFISQKRVDEVGDTESFWPGAPDLAAEVLSPGDRYIEVEKKVFDWLNAGTQLVIVVDPRKHIVTTYRSLVDVQTLTEEDILSGGDVIPGWSIPVKELFL